MNWPLASEFGSWLEFTDIGEWPEICTTDVFIPSGTTYFNGEDWDISVVLLGLFSLIFVWIDCDPFSCVGVFSGSLVFSCSTEVGSSSSKSCVLSGKK